MKQKASIGRKLSSSIFCCVLIPISAPLRRPKQTLWVLEEDKEKFTHKEFEYVPGLYKIFDEILVNAADNFQRDKTMDTIKVTIDESKNQISVWNNGQGIPIQIHGEYNIHVPELIFGHLLTSSNYDDTKKKTTGGRNGYGAKLTNIFSKRFTIETADRRSQKYNIYCY